MKVFYRLNLNSYIKSKSILLIISFTHLQLSNISVSTIFRGFWKKLKHIQLNFVLHYQILSVNQRNVLQNKSYGGHLVPWNKSYISFSELKVYRFKAMEITAWFQGKLFRAWLFWCKAAFKSEQTLFHLYTESTYFIRQKKKIICENTEKNISS